MRVLFVLQYPGYLRYYDSVVLGLVERGHTVHLAFDSVIKQNEGLVAIEGVGDGVVVVGRVPKRTDLWEQVVGGVRGTMDYLKFLQADYKTSPYYRRRWQKYLPRAFGRLSRVQALPSPLIRLLVRVLRRLERAIPPARAIDAFVSRIDPDVVFVSPLIMAFEQTDIVKSAQRMGRPALAGITSWDHLSTKGTIRSFPDRVLLWNDVQRSEAIRFHQIPPELIEVTGAQPFDRWFDRRPATTREEFCRKVGLVAGRPFVLFAGSTASISEPDAEQRFVRSWVKALRAAEDPEVANVSVLVRPHPYNSEHWSERDLADLPHTALWPRAGANPVDEDDRNDYFDSLYHSVAVTGINTSAMIEAAILGRAVHAARLPEFRHTQDEAVHFTYLLPENGGFLQVARSLDEHVDQLAKSIRDPERVQAETGRFVSSFVRPRGVGAPATPIVVDAIERVAAAGRESTRTHAADHALRALMWPLAVVSRYSDRVYLSKDIRRLGRWLSSPLDRIALAARRRGAESTAGRIGFLAWLVRRQARGLSVMVRGGAGEEEDPELFEMAGSRNGAVQDDPALREPETLRAD